VYVALGTNGLSPTCGRKDDAEYLFGHTARLIEALRKRGVREEIIKGAEEEAA